MSVLALEQFAKAMAAKLGVPWRSSFADACAECHEWPKAQREAHVTRVIAREQSRREPDVRHRPPMQVADDSVAYSYSSRRRKKVRP